MNEFRELTIDEMDAVSGAASVAYLAGWLTETVAIVAGQVAGAAKGAATTVVKGVS